MTPWRKGQLAMAAALSLVGGGLAAPVVDTTPGTTSYLSACAVYPPLDPGIVVTSTAAVLTSASIKITDGLLPTDTLEIDPDPNVECSWFTRTCGPCPALALTTVSASHLVLTGGASPAVYQACLRRVHWRSTAFGGEEGFNVRTVEFGASDTTGGVTDTKTFTVRPPDEAECGRLLNSDDVTVTWPGEPITYGLACDACERVLIAPDVTISAPYAPDPALAKMQYATVTFDRVTRATPPAVFDGAFDRMWVTPDPADPTATWDAPCPGLLLRNTSDQMGYIGFNVTGFASPALYTRCLRRTYFVNSAPAGGTLLGARSIPIRAVGPVTAYSSQFMSVTHRLFVEEGCADGCPGPASPSDIPLPGGDPSVAMTVITWFRDPGCPADTTEPGPHRTLVVARDGVCHKVPDDDTTVRASYRVRCPTGGNGTGTISFCDDPNCGSCASTHPWRVSSAVAAARLHSEQRTNVNVSLESFVQTGLCLANEPRFGAQSYTIDCRPGNIRIPTVPRTNDFVAQWYAAPGCTTAGNSSSTIVLGPQEECHVIPVQSVTGTATAAYQVQCDPDGETGVFRVCGAGCGTCTRETFFASGQCLANPSWTGSSSVRFTCGAGAVPPAPSIPGGGPGSSAAAIGPGALLGVGMVAFAAATRA